MSEGQVIENEELDDSAEEMRPKILPYITELAKKNQFTVIGDTNHNNTDVARFVYGRGVMEALHEGGVKHVFIELPEQFQHYADDLASGKISKETFIQEMDKKFDTNFSDKEDELAHYSRVADMVLYAKENDMKVHLADPVAPKEDEIDVPEELQNAYKAVCETTLQGKGIKPSGDLATDVRKVFYDPELAEKGRQNFQKYLDNLPPGEKAKVLSQQETVLGEVDVKLAERLRDEQLAQNILYLSQGQPAGILYGANHDAFRARLKAAGKTVGNIDIMPSEDTEQTDDNRYDSLGYLDVDEVDEEAYEPLDELPVNPGEPNFNAYKRYTQIKEFEAVTIVDGGQEGSADDYPLTDYRKFPGKSPEETERLIGKFADAARGAERNQSVADFRHEVILAQQGELRLTGAAGGNSSKKDRTVYMDSETSSFARDANLSLGYPILTTEMEEELNDAYTREHEVAHTMLGLNEAGADYVAAVRLLQKYPGPETQVYLQKVADFRTIDPYVAPEKNAWRMTGEYGYGTSMAIQSALGSADIKEMTVEDMYGNAKVFDSINGQNNKVESDYFPVPVRPEMAVRAELQKQGFNPEEKVVSLEKMKHAAQSVLDSGKFEDGTPAHAILEEIVKASARLEILPKDLSPQIKTPQPEPALSM